MLLRKKVSACLQKKIGKYIKRKLKTWPNVYYVIEKARRMHWLCNKEYFNRLEYQLLVLNLAYDVFNN